MHYDAQLKVGDRVVTIAGRKRSPANPEVTAKVVAAPEKKVPRKSSRAVSKEV